MTSTFLKLLGLAIILTVQVGCQKKEHEIVNRKSESLDTFKFQLPDANGSSKKNRSQRDAPDAENAKRSTAETLPKRKASPIRSTPESTPN